MNKKHILYAHFVPSTTPPKIITWLITTKIVRKESQAILLLMVIMLTSIYITYTNINSVYTGRFTAAQAAIIQTLL